MTVSKDNSDPDNPDSGFYSTRLFLLLISSNEFHLL